MSKIQVDSIVNKDDTGGVDFPKGVTVTGVVTATSFAGNVTGDVTGNVTGDITIGAGTTSAPSLAPSGDSNTGVFFPSADTIAFAEGGAEASRIDSSGRLLVGSTSSVGAGSGQYAKLQIGPSTFGSTSGGKISIQRGQAAADTSSGSEIGQLVFSDNAGGDYAFITVRSDAAGGSSDYPGRIEFSTTADGASSPTERMRINSSGELHSLNYTTDGWWLRQGATGSASTPMMRFRASSADTRYHIEFSQGTSTVGSISATSGGTSYNTTSDYRLKENVVDLDGAIDRVKQLAPKRFNFIANVDTTVDGFLAHEAQTVVPEAVTGTHNEVDDEGNPVYQGIDQSKLVPLLTAALQEAIAKIETLEAKVAALEAN